MNSLKNKFSKIAEKALKQKANDTHLDLSVCSVCKKKIDQKDAMIKETCKTYDEIFNSMCETFDVYYNVDLKSELGLSMKQYIINEYNKNVKPVCVCKKCNQNSILNNKQKR